MEYCDILKRKIKWIKDEIIENIKILSKIFEIINVDLSIKAVQDDEDDNKTIEYAVKTQADFIISGDAHLLKLRKYKSISIIKPFKFLKKISYIS